MNVDAKEIIIKFFLVRMKEACEDALFLKPILSLKKFLKKSWLLQMAPDFLTPTFFLLMILMQNFILANNHVKAEV